MNAEVGERARKFNHERALLAGAGAMPENQRAAAVRSELQRSGQLWLQISHECPERSTTELDPARSGVPRDEDSLGPYRALDDILGCLIEGEMTVDAIVARGHDRAYVNKDWRMLDLAEYKRRQAPPGVKITRRAFGRDRRYPITNGFRPPR